MRLDQLAQVKRLVIYFFYDKEGIVDRYVPYMLEEMKKNCTELFVVCNGKLTPSSREKLEAITQKVLVRENTGFDVWAYKAAMEQYGWEKLSEFDEVVLMNFTIYGPLYPFAEVFQEMDARDLDFWGLTKHYKIPYDPFGTIDLGYVPEHIQSSFICVRKKMLDSLEFHNYWDHMGPIHDYREAVGKHEAIFTKTFMDYGYTSGAYVETDDLEACTWYPLMFKARELIQHRKCPIFKKKMFTGDYAEYIGSSTGEAAVETFQYIREHLDYDLDMVWENLLRTGNMADIKDRMHLNYVLSKSGVTAPQAAGEMKTALFMHLYFDDLLDESMRYAGAMPENADIYFTVCTEQMAELVRKAGTVLAPRKVTVISIENRGRDVSSLLIGAAPYVGQYEVACFAHDKKTAQLKPYTIGESFAYRCLENVLGSADYVKNIIGTFYTEPRMGLLMPPPPNHAAFYDGFGAEWTCNYENTAKLAEKLGIHVDLDPEKEPISPLGTMFWFRPAALKPLFDKTWKFEDFPAEPNKVDGTILHAIERLYGFAAQNEGYYAAWGMNDRYAAIEWTNEHYMLKELSQTLHLVAGWRNGFLGMVHYLRTATQFTKPRGTRIKSALKKVTPEPIWVALRTMYHRVRGK